MTNHASRENVFRINQIQQQDRARHGVDGEKVRELHEAIAAGTVDLGPQAVHLPLDPQLRPNPPDVAVREELARSLTNGHSTNGWKPH